jgi:hypothetical protein
MTVKKKKAVKRKPRRSGCSCLVSIQKSIKEQGYQVAQELIMNFDTGKASMSQPSIRLEKTSGNKSRKPIPTFFCVYCPFCGKRYPE